MLLADDSAFLSRARALPADREANARGLFMVRPEGFALAQQSAEDNVYMDRDGTFDADRALRQHAGLAEAMSAHCPVRLFDGDPQTPDAVFPNNVFGSAPGRVVIGHMRHPVRQREAERRDIPDWLLGHGGRLVDLRRQPGIVELTGSMVIDRARGIGFAGYSERCDPTGAAAMLDALDLRLGFGFELAAGEYHLNVVMSVLSGRALVIAPCGLADPERVDTLATLYAPHVLVLDESQKNAFAGNCIAVDPGHVWMSERAADSLRGEQKNLLERAGFALCSVPLDEIEKAGGSLRCCAGERF